jgi:double-stranded RNA-binding protein Staufen
VSLKVGQRDFIGEGATRQAARHNAAERALKVLKYLPMLGQAPLKKGLDSSDSENESDNEDNEKEDCK